MSLLSEKEEKLLFIGPAEKQELSRLMFKDPNAAIATVGFLKNIADSLRRKDGIGEMVSFIDYVYCVEVCTNQAFTPEERGNAMVIMGQAVANQFRLEQENRELLDRLAKAERKNEEDVDALVKAYGQGQESALKDIADWLQKLSDYGPDELASTRWYGELAKQIREGTWGEGK